MVARSEPQAAYAAFTISLQSEWVYIGIVPGCEEFLNLLEAALHNLFLQVSLGEQVPTDGKLREITTLATKAAGITVYDLCCSAPFNYEAW